MYRAIYSLIIILYCNTNTVNAQSTLGEANASLDAAQVKFLGFLDNFHGDKGIRSMMEDFCNNQVDSLQAAFNAIETAGREDKIKSINTVKFFIQALRTTLERHQLELYDVPDALKKFPLVADAIVHKTPYREYVLGFGGRRTQLMADAFRQYPEGKVLQYAADVRRLSVNPDNILPLLERQPEFPFVDTALVYVAEHSPMSIVDYVSTKNNRITDTIKNLNHPLLNQLLLLSGNRNASEIAPLAGEMALGKYTAEDIQKIRSSDVKGYYQLLVNTIQSDRSIFLAGGPAGMQPALRAALKEKAIAFYVQPVNELHESKDPVRFASLQPLRVIDLYYLVISGEEELYTSSFLGIYKRIMQAIPAGNADSLLTMVQYDQFRKFIRVCSHYNVLTDFLNHMPELSRVTLLNQFIAGIEGNTESGLEDAMDVADAFAGLSVDPQYSGIVEQLLKDNRTRCELEKNYYGIRLYGILLDVFNMAHDPNKQKFIFSKLGNYELLPVEALKDKKGVINQLVIFYGDKDGMTSFQNFLALFKDARTWQVFTKPQWIEINSISGSQPIKIFANKPLNHEDHLDEQAQLAMLQYMKEMEAEAGVIIHRGHSYHLAATLNYLQPNMKLAILGSCGGYKNILTVAEKSPAAQVVATKQVGSKLINDPMILMVNDYLLHSRDIYWPDAWTKMGARFASSNFTRDLFAEYVPPYRNLGLFVIRLYNYDEASF
jgi:hypothetical protein